MDFLFTALSIFLVLLTVVLAFVVWQALVILFRWADFRWRDDWGKRPLLLRVPPRVLSVVLALAFVSLVL